MTLRQFLSDESLLTVIQACCMVAVSSPSEVSIYTNAELHVYVVACR